MRSTLYKAAMTVKNTVLIVIRRGVKRIYPRLSLLMFYIK